MMSGLPEDLDPPWYTASNPRTDYEKKEHDSSILSTDWIPATLGKLPISKLYPEIAADGIRIISEDWAKRFPRTVWTRLMKQRQLSTPRILKELNEIAPVIDRVKTFVDLKFDNNTQGKHEQRFTIVDLGCGLGFLSMFLAEMLSPEKVKEIYMVDKMWPSRSNKATETDGVHMNRQHIDIDKKHRR